MQSTTQPLLTVRTSFSLSVLLCAVLSFCLLESIRAQAIEIVPQPQQLTPHKGPDYQLTTTSRITYQTVLAKGPAEWLAAALRPATGFPLQLSEAPQPTAESIHFNLAKADTSSNKAESYSLTVQANQILISATDSAGFFYAAQTLRQLLPTAAFSSVPSSSTQWAIPQLSIYDYPSYSWRGMMLDVSRYFFNKEYVLRYLDMMALHKMNVLHWHLIDDAGWRIEIKKYPKLTEVGGFRGKGKERRGGFYTQEEIREIVAYASARNITIVPEIELPAHTLPALVAYPHLGCFNKALEVPTRHFISQDLYCPGKETTWRFLEDVFDEVCDLFPGTYIHIGGDEAKYTRWKKCPDCQKTIKDQQLKNEHALQGWMTTRVEKYLAKKNKRIIGWDEILGAGVSNQAGIMTWARPGTAVKGAQRGNPVVMSLTGHAYFDVAESKLEGEPPTATWIPPISLKKSYQWEPTPEKIAHTPAAKNILGASGCIWTDMFLHKPHILADKPNQGSAHSEAYVDYLSLPRMASLAEVTWTAQSRRNFDHFSTRMKDMYVRYDHLGYQYRIPVPAPLIEKTAEKTFRVSAQPAVSGASIRYTTDGSEPSSDSKELTKAITVANIDHFRAATFTAHNSRQSLTFLKASPNNKFAKIGKVVGHWKAGEIGNSTAKEVSFDATGLINSNGTYIITFQYTNGRQRLDIDGVEVVRNDTVHVDKDIHHGFTGSGAKNNRYTIKVNNYETGASFKIKALIYGDEGSDSNGVVLIRKK